MVPHPCTLHRDVAAQQGHEAVILYLVKECGADVNQACHDGWTPLMIAASNKYEKKLIKTLLQLGADPQVSVPRHGTAADLSKHAGTPTEVTLYLEARTHCSNTGCNGAGRKCCAAYACKQARYCCKVCQRAHWPAHKAECKVAAETRTAKSK
jgi:hypothetical protein